MSNGVDSKAEKRNTFQSIIERLDATSERLESAALSMEETIGRLSGEQPNADGAETGRTSPVPDMPGTINVVDRCLHRLLVVAERIDGTSITFRDL